MPEKHNVLLITADQLRSDALGCYGNTVCRTPNLDRLAQGGVVFENAFTPNPICVPARACITTGNYSHRAIGTKDNGGRILDGQPKLAEHFAACGYDLCLRQAALRSIRQAGRTPADPRLCPMGLARVGANRPAVRPAPPASRPGGLHRLPRRRRLGRLQPLARHRQQ